MPLRIRPNVLRMTPYASAIAEDSEPSPATEPSIRLATNENPFGPSPKAAEAIRLAASKAHLYPDGSGAALRRALSRRLGVPAGCIVLGNGSDEIIRLLGCALIDSLDDEVLVADPTFVVYQTLAEIAPCKLVKAPLTVEMEYDLAAMSRLANDRTRLVFLANPNNPTGTIVRKSELEAFLGDLPSSALVVLDEAYFEFARQDPEYPNGIEQVRRGANAMVLRTFSKAYGLAGVRCGYGVCPPELADAIERCREPFNVNSLAQAACLAALEDEEHVLRTVEGTQKALKRIVQALRSTGCRVWESRANFVFADMGRPSAPACEELLRRGIAVRGGEVFGKPSCLRVSAGTPAEIEEFERAWAEAGKL